MEYKVALLVFLLEMAAAVVFFYRWVRTKSDFGIARAKLVDWVRSNHDQGSLRNHLEELAEGRLAVYQRKKSLLIYVKVLVSAVLGVALTYLVKYLGADLWVRFFVGVPAIFPFVYYVTAAVAEEFDENKIANFERITARRLLSLAEDATLEDYLQYLAD